MSASGRQRGRATGELVPAHRRSDRGTGSELWRSLTRNRLAVFGLFVLIIIGIASVMAPWLAPRGFAEMQLDRRLQPPSFEYLLGTDSFGRDILSRILYGGRSSLLVAFGAVGGALFLGVILGGIAAYYRGWVDEVVMRSVDVVMAFPYIVLAIALVVLLQPGLVTVIVVIAILQTPHFIRVTRAAALVVMNQDYVVAAHAVGQRDLWILGKHVLPNCITPLVVMASLSAGTAITAEAALSFLGLGLQPPTPSWGGMIFEGTRTLTTAPWTTVFAGVALSLTVAGFNLLGDGMRDALDPRLRRL